MRVSNNIHNIAILDEAEFMQTWTEEEKIPVKHGGTKAPPKPKEEPKAEDKKEDKKEDNKEGEA